MGKLSQNLLIVVSVNVHKELFVVQRYTNLIIFAKLLIQFIKLSVKF